MRVCCMTELDELAPYADAWDRLAAGVPFRSWTWLSHWWRHYGPSDHGNTARRRLAALCVFDDADSLVGIAPWYVDCSAMHGRVLQPLGSGEVCSDYLGLLCHPTKCEAVVDALVEYLVENAVSDQPDALRWDLLALDSVDAEDRPTTELVDRLAGSDCTVHRRPGMSCWRLELPTRWEDYLTSVGKHLRRDAKRLEREVAAGHVALHEAARQDELPAAMDILADLHQRRRRMLGDSGRFASPRFAGFLRDVAADLLRHGQVQLWWMEYDGKPAAAEYHLLGGGMVYVYQSGLDPDAMECRPGKLLNLLLMRRAIERGYRAYDLLRGDEAYKARFYAQARPMVQYRVVPHRPVAQIRHTLWRAGSNMKKWLRSMKAPKIQHEAATE
jgi:CelD/BcsL family acetyltransferase involved in cellulose biosynthesis